MRRYIVYVPSESGGVRNVTENLADEMVSKGWDVKKINSLAMFIYYGLFSKNYYCIASLGSGLFSWLYPKSIYILHGFPMADIQPIWKRIFLRFIPKLAAKLGTKLVAVSYLTKSIYERIYGVKVDRVIHNGASEIFFNYDDKSEKHKIILYLGRLVKGKGIEQAIKAFEKSKLYANGYSFHVIGSGPLANEIKTISAINPWLIFHGAVDEQIKIQLLLQSEIFVSLNDFEPMGVVFVEALFCKCKIVAPYVGGFREFIPVDYSSFYCDPSNLDSIANAFLVASTSNFSSGSFKKEYFSYKKIVGNYLEVIES